MKNFSLFTLIFSLAASAAAAVPQKWTVEASRVAPVAIDAYHGETLALEATFQSYGKPLEMPLNGCCILWQTNGMGSAWWQSPATVNSNRVAATFTPAMDPGAASVIGFIGATGQNYRAAFTLRFRHGPGGDPAVLPLPARAIDCATVTWQNPADAPFASKADVEQKLDEQDATRLASTVITNHVTSGYLATVAEAQAMTNAISTAASSTYLKKAGGLANCMDGMLCFDYGNRVGIYKGIMSVISSDIEGKGNILFKSVSRGNSYLTIDDSPVATSNMVNGIVEPIADTVAVHGDSIDDIVAEVVSQSEALQGKADAATVASHTSQLSQLSQSLSAKLDAAAATNVAASASVTNAGAVAYVDAATNAVLRVVGFANEMLESAL